MKNAITTLVGTAVILFPLLGRAASESNSACSSPDRFRARANGVGIVAAVTDRGRIVTSADGKEWTERQTGIPFALHGIAFANGQFVAVGNEGAIITSGDGIQWRQQSSITDERLRSVTWGKDCFAAVGYSGTIITSRDGVHWSPASRGPMND